MPADKEFQTVYNQIRLLKQRNLSIPDLKLAKESLLSKNYFNLINGFENVLLSDVNSNNKLFKNTAFDDFNNFYDFDLELSSVILRKISEFETKLKTSIAYYFAQEYCCTLLENSNYIDINNYKIPSKTDGPKEYVNYFYKLNKPKNTHKLFRNNYYFEGRFTGLFNGKITYEINKTILEGEFKGRFGSTSINFVNGKCTFYNSNHSALINTLNINYPVPPGLSLPYTVTVPSATPIAIRINRPERIYGLNYIDDCKTKFPYVDKYNNPPFWVVVKTLMFNDLIILMYGLRKRVFDNILRSFNIKPTEKQKFLNSLEVLKQLRNACAHFELITHFKTNSTLKIDQRLINDLNLKPDRTQYSIRLYDTLNILKQFIDLNDIKTLTWQFWDKQTKNNQLNSTVLLFKQMGNHNIYDWI